MCIYIILSVISVVIVFKVKIIYKIQLSIQYLGNITNTERENRLGVYLNTKIYRDKTNYWYIIIRK